MYTYKDWTRRGEVKMRRTSGRFAGWTKPTGLLSVRYAIFRNRAGVVLVPEYLLTAETKQAIARLRGGLRFDI